jgi:ribosomal-protein-alanine N-acetyltransferase
LKDIDDMYEYCSQDKVSQYVSWNTHTTKEDTREFLDNILKQYQEKTALYWGIEWRENQKLIGTINFVMWNKKHHKAEIGYILSPEYWGEGVMTEALNAVIRFGFEQMDLVRIEARCIDENIGSERVMIKNGMSFEGIQRNSMLTKGKYRNIKWYSILREEISQEMDELQ